MKPVLLALVCLIASPNFAKEQATHLIEGEDATSEHHYLFYSEGDTITKVRWIWNGGAQNKPTVEDFEIKPDSIHVRKSTGRRNQTSDLISGKDVNLKITDDYTLPTKQPLTSKTFSAKQQTDLFNLISLLSKIRCKNSP